MSRKNRLKSELNKNKISCTEDDFMREYDLTLEKPTTKRAPFWELYGYSTAEYQQRQAFEQLNNDSFVYSAYVRDLEELDLF